MNSLKNRRRSFLVCGTVGAMVAATGLTGCNNALEGAFSGAGLGALAGMGIGAMSGNMGEGAAIGAIMGGVGGAILGDQNARRDRPQGGYYQDNYYHGNYYPD